MFLWLHSIKSVIRDREVNVNTTEEKLDLTENAVKVLEKHKENL